MEEEEVMVTVTMMGVMGIVMDTQVIHEPRNIVTIDNCEVFYEGQSENWQ